MQPPSVVGFLMHATASVANGSQKNKIISQFKEKTRCKQRLLSSRLQLFSTIFFLLENGLPGNPVRLQPHCNCRILLGHSCAIDFIQTWRMMSSPDLWIR